VSEESAFCRWCGQLVELRSVQLVGREPVCKRCFDGIVDHGQQQYDDDVYEDPFDSCGACGVALLPSEDGGGRLCDLCRLEEES
jgi:hypothetical protein